ncbi:HlyD family secretion protein [Acinetobacter guerrae]|uniref:HlyD family secretion protein n=1 Tax=Acinetobacter guerrae TaxID=1843371 RepID=UPI00128C64AB|nr:HlyD family secretion protein [Acinetobacter guerrae]MPW45545.1 multidrug transporter [Acinetobacter guerrae]
MTTETIQSKRPFRPWLRVVIALVVMFALFAAVYYVYFYWSVSKNSQSSDNAYVKGDLTYIANKVSGYVTKVNVSDNQHVQAGQVLAEIDATDYQSAVDQAQAKILEIEASQHELEEKIKLAQDQVEISRAEIAVSKAAQLRADNHLKRTKELAAIGGMSKSEYDKAVEDTVSEATSVNVSNIKIKEAQQNIEVLKAQSVSLKASLVAAKANLAQTQNNLSATKLVAPREGTVVSRKVREGEFVSVGKNLIVVAPATQLWIEANLKETQLSKLTAGDRVEFSLDAIPHQTFCGKIDSISRSSGAELALLPADNATGNFTKIVRRFPVKISFDPQQKGLEKIAIGMSAIVNLEAYTANKTCPS